MSEKIGNWQDDPCYYCTCQDAGKTGVLLGPFRTEKACREYAYIDQNDGGSFKHISLVDECQKIDPKSWFYSFGMVKMKNGYRTGLLNDRIAGCNTDMCKVD